jgi:prepilin-type N-terminal cleavage/methylation domain-containing protein
MQKKSRGFSLIEILVGAAISVMAAMAALQFFQLGQKYLLDSSKRIGLKVDMVTLQGALQKQVASKDLRFFAFSGLQNDQALARFLIPLPSLCRDLSVCPNDTSFFYISYEKLNTPSVNAICFLNQSTLLVDTSSNLYGTSTLNALDNKFTIATGGIHAAGDIQIQVDQLLSLINPPNGTLWRVIGAPSQMTLQWDAVDGVFESAKGDFPEPCLANAIIDPGSHKPEGLIKVPIEPLLQPLTGGSIANISSETILASVGNFPMRLSGVIIRGVGRKNDGTFGLVNCVLNKSNVSCSGSDILHFSDIKQARVTESFSVLLNGAPDSVRFYEIMTGSMSSLVGCGTSDTTCHPLIITDIASIPVLLNGTESFESISADGFSYLKQEALTRIQFRLTTQDEKEKLFDVYL